MYTCELLFVYSVAIHQETAGLGGDQGFRPEGQSLTLRRSQRAKQATVKSRGQCWVQVNPGRYGNPEKGTQPGLGRGPVLGRLPGRGGTWSGSHWLGAGRGTIGTSGCLCRGSKWEPAAPEMARVGMACWVGAGGGLRWVGEQSLDRAGSPRPVKEVRRHQRWCVQLVGLCLKSAENLRYTETYL